MATFGMVASASAVKINNNLSINGFIDGSYEHDNGTTQTLKITLKLTKLKLNFHLNVGNVSGVIAIRCLISSDSVTVLDVEQAHFTYT